MRFAFAVLPLALTTGCAQVRAVVSGLYDAFVHHSGAPSRAEQARIDERQRVLLRDLPRRRLLVLPVAVLGQTTRYDTAAAAHFVDEMRAAGLGDHHVADQPIVLPFKPQPNEARIYWTRFTELADSVRAHPRTDADYVVAIDVFGVAPTRHTIGAVHVMIVTATGDMAYRGVWNSHQALYKELQPATVDDAVHLVATDITRRARAQE